VPRRLCARVVNPKRINPKLPVLGYVPATFLRIYSKCVRSEFRREAETTWCTYLFSLSPARVHAKLKMIHPAIAWLLLFSGIAVLGYAGFQYGAMLLEQRHLQALWREQQEVSRAGGHYSQVGFHESNLTRLSVPSIRLSAVVVEGTDLYSLLIGPGHMVGTARLGEAGNAVVSGHRDTFFRDIVKLRQGDQILIERNGRTFIYAVEESRIVERSDISVAAPTGDNRLTLITCDPAYYLGPAPRRLVVVSKLLQTSDAVLPDMELSKRLESRVKQASIEKPMARRTPK
jgi:LPXTG-site transpeptidase (sortase) family protein